MTTSQNRSHSMLILLGIALLAYALAGNYVALPGYIRFLERGGTSQAGNAFDMAVLIGAAKTILWMFSFQLGILCLAAAHAMRHGLYTRHLVLAITLWLIVWAWPSLPAPGTWFYVGFGGALLAVISMLLAQKPVSPSTRLSRTLFLGAVVFFALATWEICGLGSTGRMLHPEQAAEPLAHNLLVTQSSKLMIELVIAWSLLLASARTKEKTA